MEPRDRAAPALTEPVRFALRTAAAALLLLGATMAQAPGFLVADTKFDLVLAPDRFLARALHLWDPSGQFGQLQNQAYGYLWPMGPFFAIGSGAGVPEWAVQRFWAWLVLAVALIGATLLVRTLGVRSHLASLVAGLAFALSPRLLTTVGSISIEAWPSAVAPWVLLALVIGSERGSPRWWAALAGAGVAMVGGVNAAATFAVIPLGVLWVLTRSPGPRRRALMLWWPLFTIGFTAWWLVPLLTLGAYSPPFLDFIESASVTTFPTTLVDAVRGVSDWVPYVDPAWRAGNDLLRNRTLIVDTGVLVVLGATGIALSRNPHRLFLVTSLGLGLFLVTMGHLGSVQGWLATALNGGLDAALAPLRNVHKFDVVIRLPLVTGLAFSLDAAVERWRAHQPGETDWRSVTVDRAFAGGVALLATAAVLGSALPLLTGRLTPSGAVQAVPDYWREAVAHLDRVQADEPGTALLLPGSSFGSYVWGTPEDEPVQGIGTARWAVRNAVPLTPAATIRMLDAVETWVNEGRGSLALTEYLERAGVNRLVVRNDLVRSADITDPVLVHQALARSPGIVREATFGPTVGGSAHLDEGSDGLGRVLINGGWQDRYPAVEVFRVGGESAPAVAADSAPVVVGGPEDLLDLQDLGILASQPTVLSFDRRSEDPAPDELVLTDGLRLVERNFGRVHDGTSATRLPGQPTAVSNPVKDYLPDGAERWQTHAELTGADAVTSSPSMSDANVAGVVQRGQHAAAALDGDPSTAWVSQRMQGERPWWRLDLERGRAIASLTLTAGPDDEARLRVRTEHATSEDLVLPPGTSRSVALDDPHSGWVQVDSTGPEGAQLALAEVQVPGVDARRVLVLPEVPETWDAPDRIVLRAVGDSRTGCAEVDDAVRCVPGREVAAEEPHGFSRRVTLPAPTMYTPRIWARAVPGRAAERLLLRDQPLDVETSSQAVPDLRASALAAVDGDLGTTWQADLSEFRPSIRLSWLGERAVVGFRMSVDPDANARRPSRVAVGWPGGSTVAEVSESGRVRFPEIRTDQLSIRVLQADPASTLDFGSVVGPVPIGVSEIRVHHVPFFPFRPPVDEIELPCGSGPSLLLDGRRITTSVSASFDDLYSGRAVPATVCDSEPVVMGAGQHELETLPSSAFTPVAVVLGDDPLLALPSTGVRSVPVSESAGRRRYDLVEDGALLATTENTNPGWAADSADTELTEQTVDGWRQGWAGAGTRVEARFAPDRAYRIGLAVGLSLAVLLLGLVLLRGRRWPVDAPAVGEARAPGWVLALLAVLGGGLLAGTIGALVAAAAWVVGRLTGRAPEQVRPVLIVLALLPAVGAYVVRPWGGVSGWAGVLSWPQVLVVVGWALLLGWLSSAETQGGRSRRSLWAGSSTRR